MKKDYYAIHFRSYSEDYEEVLFYGITYSFEEALKIVREDVEKEKEKVIDWFPGIKVYQDEPAILSNEVSDHQIACTFAYGESKEFDDCEMFYEWMITKKTLGEAHWDQVYER